MGSVASPRLVYSGRLEVDARFHGVFGVGCLSAITDSIGNTCDWQEGWRRFSMRLCGASGLSFLYSRGWRSMQT